MDYLIIKMLEDEVRSKINIITSINLSDYMMSPGVRVQGLGGVRGLAVNSTVY